jgi:hypothetical protein
MNFLSSTQKAGLSPPAGIADTAEENIMTWFYATKDKTQAGPVDDAALDELYRSGAVTGDTLIWKEGMAEWQPFATQRPLPETSVSAAPVGGVAVASGTRCGECGQVFPADQLITLAGRPVCAACKPLAVQRLQEGVVGLTGAQDPEQIWARIQQRGFSFTIGSVLSRTFSLVLANLWPCIGVTVLCYLVLIGSQQIPFLGLLAVFFVQPQILAGLNWYFLKQFRGESATLNDSFEGFRRGFGQQALYMLIVMAIVFAVIFAVAIPSAILIPNLAKASDDSGSSTLIIVLFAILTPVMLGAWYLMLCWLFTPLLILDKGLKAGQAMKLSRRVVQMRFWRFLGLFIVIGLLCLVGLAALIVGILFALPISFGAISRVYEDAFGDREVTA